MDLLGNVLLVDKGGRSRLAREALGVNFGFFFVLLCATRPSSGNNKLLVNGLIETGL